MTTQTTTQTTTKKLKLPINVLIQLTSSHIVTQFTLFIACILTFAYKSAIVEDLSGYYHFNVNELVETTGKIDRVAILPSDEDSGPGFSEIKFTYTNELGEQLSNYSYVRYPAKGYKSGDEVTVEYVLFNPKFARVKDTWFTAAMPIGTLIILLMLFLMALPALIFFINGVKKFKQLQKANLDSAKFVAYERKPEEREVDGKVQYKATLQLENQASGDEQTGLVFYIAPKRKDFKKNNQFIVLHSDDTLFETAILPKSYDNVRIETTGEISAPSLLRSTPYLILPILYIYVVFFTKGLFA